MNSGYPLPASKFLHWCHHSFSWLSHRPDIHPSFFPFLSSSVLHVSAKPNSSLHPKYLQFIYFSASLPHAGGRPLSASWTGAMSPELLFHHHCLLHGMAAAAAAAKSLQSCPTLCDPINGSPPGSPVPGILQARTLEWVAISFSSA